MKKRIIGVVIAIFLMAIVAFVAVVVAGGMRHDSPEQSSPTEAPVPVVTEEPFEQPMATAELAPAITEAPMEELVVIDVIPNVTEVPTPEPIAIVITSEPTEVPTSIPTEVPTPIPTEVPTHVPTAEPTPEPTLVPTEVPTPEPTPEPTPIPTEVPTPEPPQNDYSTINAELSCLTCGSGIYSSYDDAPTYDLYNYISIQDISAPELFNCLTQPFEKGIASLTAMQFDGSRYGTDALAYALNSSVDGNSGRVVISDHPENSQAISNIFDQIRQSGDYRTANSLMLDWIYKYTKKSPDNSWERLIIACN